MISTRSSQVWWVEPGGSGTSGIVIEAESVARGMPGTISASTPRRSSARSRIGRPKKSESGLPSTPRPRSRWSIRPTKVSITSLEPRRKRPWSTIRSRSIATPSLSRKRTSSGGASTVAARPTARSDSRLPKVRRPGSPGPRPTMRITMPENFARRGLVDSRLARSLLAARGGGRAPRPRWWPERGPPSRRLGRRWRPERRPAAGTRPCSGRRRRRSWPCVRSCCRKAGICCDCCCEVSWSRICFWTEA